MRSSQDLHCYSVAIYCVTGCKDSTSLDLSLSYEKGRIMASLPHSDSVTIKQECWQMYFIKMHIMHKCTLLKANSYHFLLSCPDVTPDSGSPGPANPRQLWPAVKPGVGDCGCPHRTKKYQY